MKQKFLFLFAMVLLPLMSSADDAVEINGIYYILIPKAKMAEVTSNPNGYTGSVNIPATVTYNGKMSLFLHFAASKFGGIDNNS